MSSPDRIILSSIILSSGTFESSVISRSKANSVNSIGLVTMLNLVLEIVAYWHTRVQACDVQQAGHRYRYYIFKIVIIDQVSKFRKYTILHILKLNVQIGYLSGLESDFAAQTALNLVTNLVTRAN